MRARNGQGQALPLRRRQWAILWAPINHWYQIIVWKFINRKMKQWENYYSVIIMNTSSETNNPTKPFLIILSTILQTGKTTNFTENNIYSKPTNNINFSR